MTRTSSSPARLVHRLRAPLAGALVLAALAPAGAAADTTNPVFTCRASAAYAELPGVLGTTRIEPIVANGLGDSENPDRAQCVNDQQGAPNVAVPPGDNPGVQLTLQAPFARTSITPELGAARDQTATAEAGAVEPVQVDLGPQALVVTADAVTSQASASCVNGVPTLTGSSEVVNLEVNGNVIALPPDQEPAVIPGEPLIRIAVNQQETRTTADGQELFQRAVVIEALLVPGGEPVATVVLAESKVDTHGDVCAAAVPPPPPECPAGSARETPTGACLQVTVVERERPSGPCPAGSTRDPASNNCIQRDERLEQRVCPVGSTFDADNQVCIIAGGPGRGDDIVVGAPGNVPVGGVVASSEAVRRIFGASTCSRGNGPGFVILGTNGNDRITGTNGADRIITFGGNDRVDGGRGNDCIEGRAGRDSLSGGQNEDIVIGGSGNDALNGGSATDRLDGGTGNDSINANFGQDIVTGGPGVDFINVATAGKAARVDCGSGRDKLRGNFNERKTVRNCETRYFLR